MSRVLVIDDDPTFRDVLCKFLDRAGFEVAAAADGAAGLRAYEADRPAVVITDVIMPEQEGIETMLRIKKLDASAKVIAISGGARIGPEDFLSMARKLGADLTFAKPFDFRELIAGVRSLVAPEARPAEA